MRAIGMPVSRRQRRIRSHATSPSVNTRCPPELRAMSSSSPIRS
jgi:hypothetical protein